MIEGHTRDSASASSDRRAGVAKRPRASQESSAVGVRRIGSNWDQGAQRSQQGHRITREGAAEDQAA